MQNEARVVSVYVAIVYLMSLGMTAGCATHSEKSREYREKRSAQTVLQRTIAQIWPEVLQFTKEQHWIVQHESQTEERGALETTWVTDSLARRKTRYFIAAIAAGERQTRIEIHSERANVDDTSVLNQRETGMEWELFERLDPAEASRIREDSTQQYRY